MNCPPKLQECLKIVYGLSKAEAQVLYYICKNDSKITKISNDLQKDRSTIQRYVKKLCDLELVQREEKTGSTPGRHYKYLVKDKDVLKKNILKKLEEWKTKREAELQKL